MIGVLADDFTGAAEIAGVALRAGRSATVWTTEPSSFETDVTIVNTDTRSVFVDDPGGTAASAVRVLAAAHPEWVFKKTDSLLRGHVVEEVEAVRRALEMRRAIIVAAIPELGRTVRGGRYLIDGVPIDETILADDPDFPRLDSDVAQLIGLQTGMPITVPDAVLTEDIERIAEQMSAHVLAAGSSAFFEVLLEVRPRARRSASSKTAPLRPAPEQPDSRTPALFVCGSLIGWRQGREAEAHRHGVHVHVLSDAVLRGRSPFKAPGTEGSLLLAIGGDASISDVAPSTLVEHLAEAAASVADRYASIYIEGGATAAAFLRRMEWTQLLAEACLSHGVVTLSPIGSRVVVTTKSGAVPWPESVWMGLSPS